MRGDTQIFIFLAAGSDLRSTLPFASSYTYRPTCICTSLRCWVVIFKLLQPFPIISSLASVSAHASHCLPRHLSAVFVSFSLSTSAFNNLCTCFGIFTVYDLMFLSDSSFSYSSSLISFPAYRFSSLIFKSSMLLPRVSAFPLIRIPVCLLLC